MLNGIQTLDGSLHTSQIDDLVRQALSEVPEVKRVLILTTDYSRADFTHLVFQAIHKIYGAGVRIDVLNTPGTHRKMKRHEFIAKLGGGKADFPQLGLRYQHYFDSPAHLQQVGVIDRQFMSDRTKGYINYELPVTVNKRVLSGYDFVICISGTIPHEGTGFSGGTKILFPGIAGGEVIGAFHWAAVLIGVPDLIGKRENPAREIVDRAAKMVLDSIDSTPVLSLNMVYTDDSNHRVVPRGLFWGFGAKGFNSAHRSAAELSTQFHIIKLPKALDLVVQQIPEMYDEWWTAMKGSYKLQKQGVLNPGARVILYAPHIKHFHSKPTMDRDIRQIGYHGRDYVIAYLSRNQGFNLNVASHVINARGVGQMHEQQESFPFELVIASQVSATDCEAVGLGYLDPKSIKREDYIGDGRLWIEQGGQYLYSI